MIVKDHIACLFQPASVAECGKVVQAGSLVDLWPLLIVMALLFGFAIMLMLDMMFPNKITWTMDDEIPVKKPRPPKP